MNSVDRFVLWVSLGFVVSGIQFLFTPWMLHFLPIVAVLHTLVVGGIFGLSGLIVDWLPSPVRRYGFFLIVFLLGSYFGVWFLNFSPFTNFDMILRWCLSIGISLYLILLHLRVLRWFRGSAKRVWPGVILAGCVVLVLKVGFVAYFPTGRILGMAPVESMTRQTLDDVERIPVNFLYPFSRSVTEAVDRYKWLLKPNSDIQPIFVLLLDGFRGDHLGKKTQDGSITPTLDELAREGISFSQFRVQSSWTKPSIASFFTGLYPNEHGTIYGGGDERGYTGHVLPESYSTLAERLESRGYSNMGVVMTSHLSTRYNYDQGFDVWLSYGNGFHSDSHTQNQALFWLLKERPRRSLVYLHVKGPHQPFQNAYSNDSYWEENPLIEDGELQTESRYQFTSTDIVRPLKDGEIELRSSEVDLLRHLYAAQVNFYDREYVGAFLEDLRRLGLYDSSLIVVTGDHGEELYDHGSYAHGESVYEETIRTPLVMKFPRDRDIREPDSRLLVEAIDLSASLVDYAEGNMEHMNGKSFMPLLNGTQRNTGAFRYSYSQNPEKEYLRHSTVIRWPWKLIYDYESDRGELYNLENDPGETSPVGGRKSLKEDLQRRVFQVLGNDSVPDAPTVSLREATETELQNLKGLGYLE